MGHLMKVKRPNLFYEPYFKLGKSFILENRARKRGEIGIKIVAEKS